MNGDGMEDIGDYDDYKDDYDEDDNDDDDYKDDDDDNLCSSKPGVFFIPKHFQSVASAGDF